jgi:hypothetical protein
MVSSVYSFNARPFKSVAVCFIAAINEFLVFLTVILLLLINDFMKVNKIN